MNPSTYDEVYALPLWRRIFKWKWWLAILAALAFWKYSAREATIAKIGMVKALFFEEQFKLAWHWCAENAGLYMDHLYTSVKGLLLAIVAVATNNF